MNPLEMVLDFVFNNIVYTVAVSISMCLWMPSVIAFPVEKDLYEQCNLKILCLYGKVEHPDCELIREQNKNILPVDINISIGNISD